MLKPALKPEVPGVYLEALKVVWYVAMAFGASGFIAVATEKHVPLRTELETEFGLQEMKENGETSGKLDDADERGPCNI